MSAISLLIKPTLFASAVCGTCFCGSAIVQHERQILRNRNWQNVRNQVIKFRDSLATQQVSTGLKAKFIAWRNRPWYAGEKMAAYVIISNAMILAAWKVPPLRAIMTKYFLCTVNPKKIPLAPMILSCFSHVNLMHFAFNMYALYSFSNVATSLLGPEQLVGLYLSAGAVSSLTSIACRLIRKDFIPSLGASGALLGVISYVCVARPDSELLLVFIPIAAGHAIKCLLVLDSVGVIARWRFMDHAAHLGGSLFGIWYATYGEKLFATHKFDIVKTWQKYR